MLHLSVSGGHYIEGSSTVDFGNYVVIHARYKKLTLLKSQMCSLEGLSDDIRPLSWNTHASPANLYVQDNLQLWKNSHEGGARTERINLNHTNLTFLEKNRDFRYVWLTELIISYASKVFMNSNGYCITL